MFADWLKAILAGYSVGPQVEAWMVGQFNLDGQAAARVDVRALARRADDCGERVALGDAGFAEEPRPAVVVPDVTLASLFGYCG